VLVLGAMGHLGYACVQAFADAGWHVLAHVRAGSPLAQHQGDVRQQGGLVHWVDAPLQDSAAWEALQQTYGKVDVVVHAMATAFASSNWSSEMPQLTHSALAIGRQLGALLLVPLSMLGCGNALTPVMHEHDPLPLPEQLDTSIGQLGRNDACSCGSGKKFKKCCGA